MDRICRQDLGALDGGPQRKCGFRQTSGTQSVGAFPLPWTIWSEGEGLPTNTTNDAIVLWLLPTTESSTTIFYHAGVCVTAVELLSNSRLCT